MKQVYDMNNILNTVTRIFEQRYGARLTITYKQGSVEPTPHFNNRWPSAFVYSASKKQVTFPLFNSKKELQAVASAGPVNNQDAVIFEEMSQFLQLTLAEHFELTTQLDDQLHRETVLERFHQNKPSTNIVELKTRKPAEPEIQYRSDNKIHHPDTSPIWISGDDINLTTHIAFCAHDFTKNWAFVNAKEIPDLVWEDKEGWSHFADITLFIPNIDTLDDEKRQRLLTNLKVLKQRDGAKPFVIVTSTNKNHKNLNSLKKHFRLYQANTTNSAKVQAQFLLAHLKKKPNSIHFCKNTKESFFLPMSPTPTNLH